MRKVLIALLLIVLASPTGAQHESHKQFHAYYQNWMNSEKLGCCNDQDCRAIDEAHERMVKGNLEVFVEGVGVAQGMSAWCPVLPRHHLSKGNAPNWSVSHICVTDYYGGKTPCQQFICYQSKPLM